jgi:zinc and cadmium transporter
MTSQFCRLLIYASLIFLTATAGGVLPLLMPNAREDRLKLFVSLGAGLLLGMAFLHIIPEASLLLPGSFGIGLLVGFLLLLVLERFVMVHACEEHGCDYHTIGMAAFAGLAVHGVIEGLALASSVMVSNIGPLVLVGILSHKAPAGFALTSLLKLAGKSNRRIIAFVLGVALSGPVGVMLAYLLLAKTHWQNSAGILLSVSAGTFLYISACDLLPELHRNDTEKFKRLTAFLGGLALAYVSGPLLGG